MPWFKVDDNLAFHHKAIAAGNAAMGLWVRAGSFCASQLTDGFVPDHVLRRLGTPAQARKLCDVRLWHRVDGGYQFHDWSAEGRQPTKAEVEEKREYERKRKAQARAKKSNPAGQEPVSLWDTAVTPTGTSAGTPPGQPESVPPGQRAVSHRDSQGVSRRDSSRARPRPDPTRPDPSSGTGPQSSTDRTARGRIDDDGLDKIADATHGSRDHASRVAADILTRANGDVRNPLGYVLKTIGETPERYRANSGRHPPGPRDPRCPAHPGEHRDRCRGCAADRLAARPSADAGVGASDEPPW